MRGCVKAGILVLAAVACASAAGRTVKFQVPPASRIEAPAVSQYGNWEVAVSFDPKVCEITCVYRLRSRRFGRTPLGDFLMPPAVSIQVYSSASSVPTTVVVDPAGLRRPTAAANPRTSDGGSLLAGKRFLVPPPATRAIPAESGADPSHPSSTAPGIEPRAALSLRI